MRVRILIGIVIGGILGFLYYKFVGCYSGACAITSNPVSSIIYGALMVTLLIELIHEMKTALDKRFRKGNDVSAGNESKGKGTN